MRAYALDGPLDPSGSEPRDWPYTNVPSAAISYQLDAVPGSGSARRTSAQRLAGLAAMIDQGELIIPIAATYPLEEVQSAYARLAERRTRGKIILTT